MKALLAAFLLRIARSSVSSSDLCAFGDKIFGPIEKKASYTVTVYEQGFAVKLEDRVLVPPICLPIPGGLSKDWPYIANLADFVAGTINRSVDLDKVYYVLKKERIERNVLHACTDQSKKCKALSALERDLLGNLPLVRFRLAFFDPQPASAWGVADHFFFEQKEGNMLYIGPDDEFMIRLENDENTPELENYFRPFRDKKDTAKLKKVVREAVKGLYPPCDQDLQSERSHDCGNDKLATRKTSLTKCKACQIIAKIKEGLRPEKTMKERASSLVASLTGSLRRNSSRGSGGGKDSKEGQNIKPPWRR